MINKMIWPEPFVTGVIPTDSEDALLCAQALCAWANCCIENPPEKFGVVMVDIAHRLGVTGSPDSFRDWADKWLGKPAPGLVRTEGDGNIKAD